MKFTWIIPDGHALAGHHWYHTCAPIVRQNTYPKLLRYGIHDMQLPADAFSEWVRKECIVTFLLPALAQKRMIQCLPRCDTFNRLWVQQTIEKVDRLFYVRLVILNIYKSGRPTSLA